MQSALTVSTANLLLERSECAGRDVPRDELRQQLERHRSSVDLAAEFAAIPASAALPAEAAAAAAAAAALALAAASDEADAPEAAVPYDRNRVALAPTAGNPAGYFNASLLDVACLRRRPAADAPDAFVVAASPAESLGAGPGDFWRVVWQSGARVVARVGPGGSVDSLVDAGGFVCEDGLEVRPDPSGASPEGAAPCRVWLTEGAGAAAAGRRRRRRRTVWLLGYPGGWNAGDGGPVPNSLREFLAFLDELDALRRALLLQSSPSYYGAYDDEYDFDGGAEDAAADVETEVPAPPVRLLLHCADGSRHCGLALCVLVYRACLQHNLPLDLPTVLCALRGQRMRLVACPRQYAFVYDAVIESLEDTRLI